MPLHKELRARLHDMLALELNLRAYLREWQTHASSPALRAGLEEAISDIGPEADGVAKCLHLLGARPRLAADSPLLEIFRQQDSQQRAEAPLEADLRCAVSALALGDLKAGLYESMIALAEMGRRPEVEATLRDLRAHVEQSRAQLKEVFDSLLAQVGKGRRKAAV